MRNRFRITLLCSLLAAVALVASASASTPAWIRAGRQLLSSSPGEVAVPSIARLRGGVAHAPADAPAAVRAAIRAANSLRHEPYVWGGGHGSFFSYGYDCSGSVSYVLHAARLLSSPLVSGALAQYGRPGPGRWVTIYANATHAFMFIAGLRFDTSGYGQSGPRWRPEPRSLAGFAVRHPAGL